MSYTHNVLVAGRIGLMAASVLSTPAAAASYDGQWNVSIASPRPSCGSGTKVSMGIRNGQVASNSGMVTASGRVAPSGAINVNLTAGMKRAVGSGKLLASSGSGTWRGSQCSGTWTARRI